MLKEEFYNSKGIQLRSIQMEFFHFFLLIAILLSSFLGLKLCTSWFDLFFVIQRAAGQQYFFRSWPGSHDLIIVLKKDLQIVWCLVIRSGCCWTKVELQIHLYAGNDPHHASYHFSNYLYKCDQVFSRHPCLMSWIV